MVEPEPDWIWAESVLTGESGAVFAELVEPVAREADPFLGYSWFDNQKDKNDVVTMLTHTRTRPGTFIGQIGNCKICTDIFWVLSHTFLGFKPSAAEFPHIKAEIYREG